MSTLRETILKHSWQEDMVGPHLVRVDDAIDALRQWLADQGLVCVPLDFIAGPNAWLASWAQHVGNCKGGYKCECGLVAARHDLARAMIAAAPDALAKDATT
jgi:hypothetical protein